MKDVNGKEISPGDIVGEYPEGAYWEWEEIKQIIKNK